jgi:uncharacterized cupredoxin-like copper-binding protein
MPRALLAVPLALAALAAGCAQAGSSAGKFNGEQHNVAAKIEQLQSAGESGDAKEICDEVLAKQLRDEMQAGSSNCEQQLDEALKDADDFDLEVEKVTVAGNTATAQVKARDGSGDRVREFELTREGGDWRVTSLGS